MGHTNTENQQLAWVNLAKAVCIVLVVVMHCENHFLQAKWIEGGWIFEQWHMLNETIRPLRMPMFFLVSGLLASSSILEPRADTERKRLLRPLYLYVVWGVILQALIPVLPEQTFFNWSEDNSLLAILLVAVAAWYMVALAVYYIFTRLTLGLPLWLVLGGCAVLSALAAFYETSLAGHQHKILRCAIFFVAGVRMKPLVLAYASSATVRRALTLLSLYLPGALICASLGTFFLIVDMLAVALGITLAAIAVQKAKALASVASWLGNRTLGIYLIHFLWLEMTLIALQSGAVSQLVGSFWLGMIYPLIVAAVIIPASIVTRDLLTKVGAWWLFDYPWERINDPESGALSTALHDPAILKRV